MSSRKVEEIIKPIYVMEGAGCALEELLQPIV